MGGAAISVPRIPYVYDPPPVEKYVFRVQEGSGSMKLSGTTADSGREVSLKKRSSISNPSEPATNIVVPELNRRSSKVGLLQAQKSGMIANTGDLQRGTSVGMLKTQPSGLTVGALKAQASAAALMEANNIKAGMLRAQSSKIIPLTSNNSDDAPAPTGLARRNSNAMGSNIPSAVTKIAPRKTNITGQRVSPKHPWILKGACIAPRSSSEFEIGRVLGFGLMGVVRVAKHKATDTYIAIKAIRKDYISKHHDGRHVANEKEALNAVSSPFVPALFGTFQDDCNVYFAMELCAGGELFRRLTRKQLLGPQTAKFYACEILSALTHIHSLGYVYRDLKPENVMVDEEGHCKLVDFGFVTTPDENGMMRTMCGTPAYLSPEQLDRKFFGGYTRICDWWSFGVFIYELRTGKTPFCKSNRETVYAIYTRILHNSIKFPSYFEPQEKELISRLCCADKEKRLGDPDQIKETAYFAGVNWDDIEARRAVPPFVPALHEVGDTRFFEEIPEAYVTRNTTKADTFVAGNVEDKDYYLY